MERRVVGHERTVMNKDRGDMNMGSKKVGQKRYGRSTWSNHVNILRESEP